MMGGTGMGGGYGLASDGRRVDTLTAARQRAQAFADRLGLRAGEVILFSNGFCAELLTADGDGATEVLVDRPERFPGYFTLETGRGATITGMMSVNATTGAVWYHTWHGSYIAASKE